MKISSPNLPRWVLLASAMFAGSVVGFFMRGSGSDSPATTSPTERAAHTAGEPSRSMNLSPAGSSRRSRETKFATSAGDNSSSGEAIETDFEKALEAALEAGSDMRRYHEFYNLVLQLDPADLPAAVERVQRLPWRDKWMAMQLLAGRWAELDPRGAASYALSNPQARRGGMLFAVGSAWASTDPDGAVAFAQTLPAGQERFQMMDAIVQSFWAHNPHRALELLKTIPSDRGGYHNLFSQWVTHDPAEATAAAMALPRGRDRDQAISGLANSWSMIDPQAALAWAGQLQDLRLRKTAFNNVMQGWANTDSQAAIAYLLAMPDNQERREALTGTISFLAQQDPERAVQLLDKLPEGVARNDALRNMIYNISQSDPKTASELVLRMSPGDDRDNMVNNVMSQWADTDAKAALEFAQQLPKGEGRRRGMQQVASNWAQNDPRAAADWFFNNRSSDTDSEALRSVMNSWGYNEPDDALAWLERVSDSKLKESLFADALGGMATTDAERAIRVASGLPGGSRERAVGLVLSQWSYKDPAAAAQWAMSQPESQARSSSLSNIASNWGRRDPTQAVAWLETLSAGTTRDAVVESFANAVQRSDPEGAAAWAATLSDANKRQSQIESIARDWLRTDIDAAKRWIGTTTAISDELKTKLLKNAK